MLNSQLITAPTEQSLARAFAFHSQNQEEAFAPFIKLERQKPLFKADYQNQRAALALSNSIKRQEQPFDSFQNSKKNENDKKLKYKKKFAPVIKKYIKKR